MSQRKSHTTHAKTVAPILLAALLLLPLLPLTSADTAGDVDRILSSSATCAQETQVSIGVDWGPSRDQATVMIEETFPSGWTPTSISHGGDLSTSGKAKWFLTDPSVEAVTYRLQVPSGAVGSFLFDGIHRDDTTNGASSTIGGDTALQVACPQAHVSRDELPDVSCDQTFTVRIQVDWHSTSETRIMVEESVPEGWTIVSASHDGNLSTAGKVKWWLDDRSTNEISYQVTAPDDAAGSFPFHGVYRDETMGDQVNAVVDGDRDIDVACGASVTRSGLDGTRQCGQSFTVTLLLDWTATDSLQIEETVPSGWTISQPSDGGSLETPGAVKWFLNDDAIGDVTYQVTVPSGADGTATFQGVFRHDALGSSDPSATILGDPTVTTSCSGDPGEPGEAAGVHRQAPSTVHPQAGPVEDTSFLVTLSVMWNHASTSQVVESLPGPRVSVSEISDGGVSNGQIQWDLDDTSVTSVTYRLTVEDTAELDVFGERTFSGTVLDDVRQSGSQGPGAITGSSSFLVTHRFDAQGDCVFGDNELFLVIDEWKSAGATDNELFSGIDAWKIRPGSYC